MQETTHILEEICEKIQVNPIPRNMSRHYMRVGGRREPNSLRKSTAGGSHGNVPHRNHSRSMRRRTVQQTPGHGLATYESPHCGGLCVSDTTIVRCSVYIGQTGRCVNDCAREHAAAMQVSPSGHLIIHCSRCSSSPVLHDVKILARYNDKRSRKLHEVYEIREKGKSVQGINRPIQQKCFAPK